MKHALSLAAICLALAACSSNSVKNTLGIGRSAPDEFRVVSRPPLSMPPEFNLVPPSDTATPPGQLPADKQAQSLLTGDNTAATAASADKEHVVPRVSVAASGTSAETQFLSKAGASDADPHIRSTLIEEHTAVQEQQEDCSWWDVFCSANPPAKEPIVNAKKEAERIKQDTDEGKPVTEGKTPDVQPKDTGILGKIFGY